MSRCLPTDSARELYRMGIGSVGQFLHCASLPALTSEESPDLASNRRDVVLAGAIPGSPAFPSDLRVFVIDGRSHNRTSSRQDQRGDRNFPLCQPSAIRQPGRAANPLCQHRAVEFRVFRTDTGVWCVRALPTFRLALCPHVRFEVHCLPWMQISIHQANMGRSALTR